MELDTKELQKELEDLKAKGKLQIEKDDLVRGTFEATFWDGSKMEFTDYEEVRGNPEFDKKLKGLRLEWPERVCPGEEFLRKQMGIVSSSLGGRHCGVQAVADILHALGDISTWDLQKLRQDPNKYINALEHAIFSPAEQIRKKDKQIRRLKHFELLAKNRRKRKRGNR